MMAPDQTVSVASGFLLKLRYAGALWVEVQHVQPGVAPISLVKAIPLRLSRRIYTSSYHLVARHLHPAIDCSEDHSTEWAKLNEEAP